jgi:hypothetical protein
VLPVMWHKPGKNHANSDWLIKFMGINKIRFTREVNGEWHHGNVKDYDTAAEGEHFPTNTLHFNRLTTYCRARKGLASCKGFRHREQRRAPESSEMAPIMESALLKIPSPLACAPATLCPPNHIKPTA